jgi:hydroxymethylglutaryl-CoA reductase
LSDSRITGLYRLSVAERIAELRRLGWLSDVDAELLHQGRQVLLPASADKMIENVVGVFAMPLAIAPNFIVNGRDYIVPMAVEEPSIVAATSNAARLARVTGGFTSCASESLLIGQIHLSDIDDVAAALGRITAARDELLSLCNAVHPRLAERGGGVREIESRHIELPNGGNSIVVHLLVDTCDAMGANLVNTICEAVASRLAALCDGNVALRILSNLADRALVTSRVRYALGTLASDEFDAETVRDRIVMASDIATVDVHRAATHNKGIMNGVDSLAIATGNDWRAIEAGAHAFAASTGRYLPLATWSVDDDGDLIGELNMPLKVGTVGANLEANAGASFGLRVAGVTAARELADLMAAVGLAQNFAALRALATSGIQQGHMKLHARSVASSAAVPGEFFDDVVSELVESGEIKGWKAAEILANKQSRSKIEGQTGTAAGKVILLGEHAVVYGKHALALPISDAVTVNLSVIDSDSTISIPAWGLREQVAAGDATGVGAAVALIRSQLGIADSHFSIHVHSKLPRAMGLGSSAAIAVAIVRAFNVALTLGFDDAKINAVAFQCEKLAHGTPSGVDNTIATFSEPMLFRNAGSLEFKALTLAETPPILIAFSSSPGLTKEQVAAVRERYDHNSAHYDAIFDEIDVLSQVGAVALARCDYAELGMHMNICHGLLNAIQVSTAELDNMVAIARAAGAVGAKMTGGGGGGSVVALCPDSVSEVDSAFRVAGFETISLV